MSDPLDSTPDDAAALPGRIAGATLILLQLGLLAAIVRLFQIEEQRHFFPLLCLLTGGYVVHACLPPARRMAWFACVSMAGMLFVLGIENGLCVLAIGGGLIGICRLPLKFPVRVALLVVAGAALTICRDRFPAPYWPVLGSLLMFRLFIYVSETRKQSAPEPLSRTVAYLFMTPNVCFPLFPVVDYQTFRATWRAGADLAVQQRGVTWILRGIVHLLLYRYIKSYVVPRPYELYDLPHVALFMATNYALYLQVSGQFHIITGLLHVFGFDLPRTHNEYFLASSCSDIWRRINIYWKDFLSKFCFFPVLHALRRRGATLNVAVVTGVFAVFAATWLLHSWQTFWLLGRFPVTANDASLWLGAGACVAVNAVWETRRSARRSRPTWGSAVGEAVRTVGMFGLVSLFWAIWTRPGFLSIVAGVCRRPGAAHGALTVAAWAAAAVVGVLIWKQLRAVWTARSAQRPATSLRDAAQLHLAGLAVLVAVSMPWFGKLLGPRSAEALAEFRTDAAAARSAAAERLQGYYEDLNMAAIQAGPLVASFAPEDESRRELAEGFAKVSRDADTYQEIELTPGVSTALEGSTFSVNEYGMRDRSLSLFKPPDTVRIALLGSSIVMGYGVGDDEVFARLFENGLNAVRDAGEPRVEVLNFGVGRQWATHRLVRAQRMIFGFDPDVLMYVAHQDEFMMIESHPARLLDQGLRLPSPLMEAVARAAGVAPGMAGGAIEAQLQQHRPEMLAAVYRTLADECRAHDALPVYVYLPVPGSTGDDPRAQLLELATSAGFTVCDLTGWETGTSAARLFGTNDQQHPTALGHRLIAAALLRLASDRPELVRPLRGATN